MGLAWQGCHLQPVPPSPAPLPSSWESYSLTATSIAEPKALPIAPSFPFPSAHLVLVLTLKLAETDASFSPLTAGETEAKRLELWSHCHREARPGLVYIPLQRSPSPFRHQLAPGVSEPPQGPCSSFTQNHKSPFHQCLPRPYHRPSAGLSTRRGGIHT